MSEVRGYKVDPQVKSFVEDLEKEVAELRGNWANVKAWVKDSRINYSGGLQYWKGYEEFHGLVRMKIKELEGGKG